MTKMTKKIPSNAATTILNGTNALEKLVEFWEVAASSTISNITHERVSSVSKDKHIKNVSMALFRLSL